MGCMAGKHIPFAAPVDVPVRAKNACIYARISFDKDERQIGVQRQESECRQVVIRDDYALTDDNVFIDNSRSAWQRTRKRPAWDAMLEGIKHGEFDALVCYHPDRLVRQPRDLEDLIDAAYESKKKYRRGVVLVSGSHEQDLNDSRALAWLRQDILNAERSSADTSRRVKSKLQANFEADLVHGGHRSFGYEDDGMTIRESEAAIIRDVADKVLKGDPVMTICKQLNKDEIRSSRGKHWSNATLWAMLTGPRVAGLRQRHGQIVGTAPWPPILEIEVWNAVREHADMRAARWQEEQEGKGATSRYYLLRGIVHCGACGSLLNGDRMANGKARYRCKKRPGSNRCGNVAIMAESLEGYVVETALKYLEGLDLSTRAVEQTIDPAVKAEMDADRQQLLDLAAKHGQKILSMEEWMAARAPIQARIDLRTMEAGATVTRSRRALTGLAGPGVRRRWAKLTPQRQNAVLKDVFGTLVVERNNRQFTRFVEAGYVDYDRIRFPELESV